MPPGGRSGCERCAELLQVDAAMDRGDFPARHTEVFNHMPPCSVAYAHDEFGNQRTQPPQQPALVPPESEARNHAPAMSLTRTRFQCHHGMLNGQIAAET